MKIHRFKTNLEIEGQKAHITDPEIIFQIKTVLRLKPGEKVVITDGKGTETLARIVLSEKSAVMLEIESVTQETGDERPLLHAYISILKKDNLELAIQKMTEIGITHITPIITERTVKKNYNQERVEKIITEAIEQSGQNRAPVLHDEIDLTTALDEALEKYDTVIYFDEPSDEKTSDLHNKSVAFFIGPEGGWSPKEIELFKEKNILSLSLGDTTLRGETATIVGAFYIKQLQK